MKGSRDGQWMLLGGAAAIAAAYFLDRKNGAQRRANTIKEARKLREKVAWGFRDAEHRIAGNVKHVFAALARGPLDDRVLEERIRSQMGRIVSRPHKIYVASDEGVVTLWGTASEPDAGRLVQEVTSMPGIREVRDHIEVYKQVARSAEQTSPVQKAHQETLLRWSPARRLVSAALGATAAFYGLKRRDKFGFALATFGGGLTAYSMLEKNVPSLLALSAECPGFELNRTIRVNAPISNLYDFWTNPENYPKVFSHISEIARLAENLYRWTIEGPAGIPIHWEGMITRTVANTIVEWKSLPGSMVGNFGMVRFDPIYDASTRVNIRMFYRPPAGILGLFVAGLFKSAPDKVLDQDLQRMKMLFETDHDLVRELKEGGDEQLLKIAKT